jgi:hypothetical protein
MPHAPRVTPSASTSAQQRGVVEHLTAVVDGCGARVCPGGGLEDVAQVRFGAASPPR